MMFRHVSSAASQSNRCKASCNLCSRSPRSSQAICSSSDSGNDVARMEDQLDGLRFAFQPGRSLEGSGSAALSKVVVFVEVAKAEFRFAFEIRNFNLSGSYIEGLFEAGQI